MLHESKAGWWETKLTPSWHAEGESEPRVKLKLCATFMPNNTTLNPDTVDRVELQFSLDPIKVYAHQNRYVAGKGAG
jgi:hypothetical protein